jgi:cysteine desulfurase
MRVYLDWAATAMPDESIYREALESSLEGWGNPSARHEEGFKARATLEEDRKRCAAVLNCEADRLFFTSGGTESNNMVLLSRLTDRNPGRIIISSLEHPSLSGPAEILKKQGAELKILRPDARGLINPDRLEKLLDKNTRLVSIMAVHNETGALQPLQEIVRRIREFSARENSRPVHIHCDMVQAPGKIPLDLTALDLDSASFSAHKIRGPKGVGLLFLKKDLPVLFRGGGQERNIRPGTESLFNSRAMALSLEKWGRPREPEAGQSLLRELSSIKGIRFNPPARLTEPDHYAAGIINFALPPLPGEVLQRILSEKGFYISTGSACSSNKKSHTEGLKSMGVDEKTAHCSVRVSLGPITSEEEIRLFLEALREIGQGNVFQG